MESLPDANDNSLDVRDVPDVSRERTYADAYKFSILSGIRRVGMKARLAALAVMVGAAIFGHTEDAEAKTAHAAHAHGHLSFK